VAVVVDNAVVLPYDDSKRRLLLPERRVALDYPKPFFYQGLQWRLYERYAPFMANTTRPAPVIVGGGRGMCKGLSKSNRCDFPSIPRLRAGET